MSTVMSTSPIANRESRITNALLLALLLRGLHLRHTHRLGRYRLPNDDVAARPAGNRAIQHQQIVLRVNTQHLEIANRDAVVPHVAGHAHALDDTRRERGRPDRSRRAVEHRAVRRASAAEVVPLDDALESLAAAGGNDVH